LRASCREVAFIRRHMTVQDCTPVCRARGQLDTSIKECVSQLG
jgi:hypothetical protein